VPAAARFGILAIVALAAALFPWPPALIESLFSQGLYPRIQPIVTTASNLVPFALLDVLAAAAVLLVAWSGFRAWRRLGRVSGTALACALTIGQLTCVAFLWFLIFWGLNYQRLPATIRFGSDPAMLSDDDVRRAAETVVRRVNETYSAGRRIDLLTAPALVQRLAPAFAAGGRQAGMPWAIVPGRPKWSLAGALFPWIGVDGMMNPLALEIILNPDVLPFERPFVLAHEWGHLAGLAGENEASFVAWLACLAGDRDARYSGWQALLIHFLRVLPQADVRRASMALAPGPSHDLDAIAVRLRRRNQVASVVSWRVYDRFLRANGVETGMGSYDEVVRLAVSTPAGRSHFPSSPDTRSGR
jgi:hypothetical protein